MPLLHLRVCTVDLASGWVERDGMRDRLSATERRLLGWFVDHGGRVVSRQELLREVWHWHARRNTRAVDTAVRRLRSRVEANPQEPDHLFTVHGVGFRFVPLRQGSPEVLGHPPAPGCRLPPPDLRAHGERAARRSDRRGKGRDGRFPHEAVERGRDARGPGARGVQPVTIRSRPPRTTPPPLSRLAVGPLGTGRSAPAGLYTTEEAGAERVVVE